MSTAFLHPLPVVHNLCLVCAPAVSSTKSGEKINHIIIAKLYIFYTILHDVTLIPLPASTLQFLEQHFSLGYFERLHCPIPVYSQLIHPHTYSFWIIVLTQNWKVIFKNDLLFSFLV